MWNIFAAIISASRDARVMECLGCCRMASLTRVFVSCFGSGLPSAPIFWWGGVARLLYRWVSVRHHIEIERCTNIGYGLRIVHGGPVVVNSSAVLGDNIDLCQFTTIGSVCLHGAHIGNNVYIGPGVCIVEGVTIGDGATIGAGAVVVKDVEAGTTVAGNPAKVISRKEPGRLVYNKWEIR